MKLETLESIIYKEYQERRSDPLFENNKFQRSAVLFDNGRGEIYEETPEGVKLRFKSSEFYKVLRYFPPSTYNYIMVTDPINYNRYFVCDISNENLRNLLFKSQILFKDIERLVHLMIVKDYDSVLLTNNGAYASSNGGSESIRVSAYEKDPARKALIQSINTYVEKFTRMITPVESYESQVMVLGVKVVILKWKTLTEDLVRITIEKPMATGLSHFEPLFKKDKGIIIINRCLLRHLPSLLKTKHYRKVAYKNFGVLNIVEENLMCSFFGEIPNSQLRNLGYDVHVIDVEHFQDPNDFLNLPAGLNILVTDLDSVSKCINAVKNIPNSRFIIKNLIIGNLLGIALKNEPRECIVFDDWSRELLTHETDLEQIIRKLEVPFIIRDDLTPEEIQNINIKDEIVRLFRHFNAINAYNIDICPGSEIRLYHDKYNYTSYSRVKMTPILTEVLMLNILTPKEIETVYQKKNMDTSYSLPGIGRYRVSITMQRSSYSLSIRKVPDRIPSCKELRLPEDFVDKVAHCPKGLTVILGEPGSGKTATFNSIVDRINTEVGGIIYLMGSPIEYTHNHKKSLVIQQDVGKDIDTYKEGIAKAYRSHTSVLGFEELRKVEEFSNLASLINSPNNILLTMHSSSCRAGVESLVMSLSEAGLSERKAREDVANALNYVIYQKLINSKGQKVLIYELMKVTPMIKGLIKEGNFSFIPNAIITEPECESLDEVIMRRLKEGLIEIDSVKHLITDVKYFKEKGFNL